ncbi:MAG: DUF805 domain-containing protein [Fuerstiella sp.]
MPFETECGHCNRTFKLKDELLGKKFKCSECGSVVIAEAILPALPVEPPPIPEERPASRRSSSASAARRSSRGRRSEASETRRPARRSSQPKAQPAPKPSQKRRRQKPQEDDLFGGGGAYDDYDDYSNDFGDVDDQNPYSASAGSSSSSRRASGGRGKSKSKSRKKSQSGSSIGFNVNRLNLAMAGIAVAIGFLAIRESGLAAKAGSEPTRISMSELIADGQPDNIYVTVSDVSAEVEEYVYEYRGQDETRYTKVFIPCRARSQNNRQVGMVLLSTSLNSDSEVNPLGRQTEFTGMIVNDIRTIAGEEKVLLNSIPGVNAGNVLIFELNRKPFSSGGLVAMYGASGIMLFGSLAWMFLTGTPDAAPVRSRSSSSGSKRKSGAFQGAPSRYRTAESLTLSDMLFRFDGRMNRSQFLVGNMSFGVAWAILQLICVFALPENVAIVGFCISILVGLFISFALSAKRAHDMGHPATINILLIVPFVNVIWGFMLLLSAGYPGDNQYGDPPG